MNQLIEDLKKIESDFVVIANLSSHSYLKSSHNEMIGSIGKSKQIDHFG